MEETTVTGTYCYPEYNFPITLYECDECGAVFLDRDDNYKYCPYCGRKIVDSTVRRKKMLIKIGETQWIKAKKINAVKLSQIGIKKQWEISVHTDNKTYIHGTYDTKDEALQNLNYLAVTINQKIEGKY